jgi:hypothetical protein
MARFYKNFFTSNLKIWSSFFYIFLLTFIFFWNFETVNSNFDGFGIRTGPIPPVFTEFRKIRPIFLTLIHSFLLTDLVLPLSRTLVSASDLLCYLHQMLEVVY